MRTSIAALALIRGTTPSGARVWLTQWNHHWHALSLVGGKKQRDESYRDCCSREIGEELGLPSEQFRVSDEPIGHLKFDAWSERAQADTHYVFEIFEVAVDPLAVEMIGANPENCWLSEAEIRASHSGDGRVVSPTVLLVLSVLREIEA